MAADKRHRRGSHVCEMIHVALAEAYVLARNFSSLFFVCGPDAGCLKSNLQLMKSAL